MALTRLIHVALSAASLTALAACDVPTSAPIYDTVWNVPAKSTSISVNTLLPAGVQVSADSAAFQVTVSPATTSISRSLAQDCPECAAANGLTVPKPAFTGGGSTSVTLPSTISSATLVRDTLTISIANGFKFDPIRPSATARGHFVITVRNGATVVGRDSIDGSTASLPPGSTTTRKIALSGTINGASGLQVATSLNSPTGDPVTIEASRTITVTGSVGGFFVSGAQVSVANQSVTSAPTDLDLTGVAASVADRANGGSLLFTVANPFDVTGNLTVSFVGARTPVTKTVPITAGESSPSVTFTREELGALLGHSLSISYGGTVNGSKVTVRPRQVVAVSSRLQISVTVGGSK